MQQYSRKLEEPGTSFMAKYSPKAKENDMALSRSFLKGMGLADEQVSAIIEAHTESTDALKAQRDEYKTAADKLSEVEKELNTLKGNGTKWQDMYEEEHKQFEAYKNEISTKDAKKAKEDAYASMLRELGINEKRIAKIMQVTDLETIEMDEAGKIKDLAAVSEAAKAEWSEFIPTEETHGAKTPTPPGAGGGSVKTKEEIMAIKDAAKRQQAILENPQLFGF